MIMKYKFIIMSFLSVFIIFALEAKDIKRPSIWGIAKMTFIVSDMNEAREYYGRFLGFDEAFSYPSELGTVVSFKVNDRQFLEFVVDKNAKEKKRLVSVSIETESVEEMQAYLLNMGVNVTACRIDGAGNEIILTKDTWGNNIEFIEWKEEGAHRKSKGKFLSENRISKRIHHVGLYAKMIDENDPFWVGVLKCREVVRYPLDKNEPGVIQYLDFGDCTECIEHYYPSDENFSHPCFLVDDMQETIYQLKERKRKQVINRPTIGRTKRWILNLLTSDSTKVEFTEPYCIK